MHKCLKCMAQYDQAEQHDAQLAVVMMPKPPTAIGLCFCAYR